ncbi:tRNA (adenosine(37)-N6)-dimethylallyltransferase MiaA [Alteribacter natronophilus]|uniref:tRNA (adenosine(37)-N6)-dimethylallyltransferase MiaA n=1 Tax=Alteribacter natronophilus TaxID=2583810 RepID=UPI00110EE65B|nr:tRNA (adenosine(37)-N6)-dimethylallyltransferase MiaA [Alteribacter natronophilus]TMW73292.1 tRNA (adenosine(37)-N6)-dimethylallyltransferase MiaA [Alteribacter natronophilus]
MTKKPLAVLAGPTAVGKTALSIKLAKALDCEIISGDSMQVYRGMDIGTAKITPEEQQGVPHHLIDIKDPREAFSVQEFQDRARILIDEIHSRGKLPFIVGGTGLYLNAVIYGYSFTEVQGNPEFREEMEAYAARFGNEALHRKLAKKDRKASESIHPNNVRRVIRALEVASFSDLSPNTPQSSEPRYHTALAGLTMERERLYGRINQRVDVMMNEGLVEEARHLYDMNIRNCQSVQAIGYKEMYAYFDGLISLEEAIISLKQNSRRFAKRQLTWFRNKMDVRWFDVTDGADQKEQEVKQFIEGKLF